MGKEKITDEELSELAMNGELNEVRMESYEAPFSCVTAAGNTDEGKRDLVDYLNVIYIGQELKYDQVVEAQAERILQYISEEVRTNDFTLMQDDMTSSYLVIVNNVIAKIVELSMIYND